MYGAGVVDHEFLLGGGGGGGDMAITFIAANAESSPRGEVGGGGGRAGGLSARGGGGEDGVGEIVSRLFVSAAASIDSRSTVRSDTKDFTFFFSTEVKSVSSW